MKRDYLINSFFVISLQQCLNKALSDIREMLASLNDLQTCRGIINLQIPMLERAIDKFRDGLSTSKDQSTISNQMKLKEILSEIWGCRGGRSDAFVICR